MTSSTLDDQRAVVDASAMVDLLIDSASAPAISARIGGIKLLAPAHFDSEVVNAVARLVRAGALGELAATKAVSDLAASPIERRPLAGLIVGAWDRRGSLRISDALYVELAAREGVALITTDNRLVRAVDWIDPV